MKVANLVTSEWCDHPRSSLSSYSQPQLSPAPSLSGSVQKFDEYRERPSPIATSATSYFSSVNSSTRISPQLPLSPPADEQRKCSLPSISSLLGGVDSMPANKRPRYDSNDYSRNFLPPTPPLRPSSGFTEGGSPSSLPSGRSHSASISSASSIPHRQSQMQIQTSLPSISASLQSSAPSSSSERLSALSISSLASQDSSRSAIPSPTSTHTSITTAPSTTTSYYSPTTADEKAYSRAQNGHSASAPVTPSSHVPPPMVSPLSQGWQHHHYFPLSTAAPYPQNHERYVCRTCHKAFSRPSSLRIHSHSHTGEKPFRCTHAGCGKAFSVRSNMKRHERGCHSGRPMAAALAI